MHIHSHMRLIRDIFYYSVYPSIRAPSSCSSTPFSSTMPSLLEARRRMQTPGCSQPDCNGFISTADWFDCHGWSPAEMYNRGGICRAPNINQLAQTGCRLCFYSCYAGKCIQYKSNERNQDKSREFLLFHRAGTDILSIHAGKRCVLIWRVKL